MKTLHLVLAFNWFDKIKAGEKTKEYREYKPYWNKRLFNNGYDFVRFQRGYSKNSETIIFRIKKIWRQIGGQNDLNLLDVWVIELGEKISQDEYEQELEQAEEDYFNDTWSYKCESLHGDFECNNPQNEDCEKKCFIWNCPRLLEFYKEYKEYIK